MKFIHKYIQHVRSWFSNFDAKKEENGQSKFVHDKTILSPSNTSLVSQLILKIHMNLSHTRHRSPTSFYVNIFSCLSAYQLRENKPSMQFYPLPLIQS